MEHRIPVRGSATEELWQFKENLAKHEKEWEEKHNPMGYPICNIEGCPGLVKPGRLGGVYSEPGLNAEICWNKIVPGFLSRKSESSLPIKDDPCSPGSCHG